MDIDRLEFLFQSGLLFYASRRVVELTAVDEVNAVNVTLDDGRSIGHKAVLPERFASLTPALMCEKLPELNQLWCSNTGEAYRVISMHSSLTASHNTVTLKPENYVGKVFRLDITTLRNVLTFME